MLVNERRARPVTRSAAESRRAGRSLYSLELFDEFPIGDEVFFQEQLEQRREQRLPARLVAEDFAGVSAVADGAECGDQIARSELGGRFRRAFAGRRRARRAG